MARSFSNAKVVLDVISKAVARRGYATAAAPSRGSGAGPRNSAPAMVKKEGEKVSWGPDPVTGYYRPESGAHEIDVAELRALLLKKH
ncbi:putative Indole-3-acetic acid-induced protein ARG2 [Tripterygium wilfordii]|uniref:Putative Indole-3-acetic acid-induced protein ARG2 n=1 Tax=Tripterygium wilfordii TaxID=458696 RepID=A0A7J7CBY4_TRIWF|nr:protein SENESCENCE-ASSOCIATED GENE 21, mitochondrial-like [Tripterygium wilfordii]KAF5731435.1 putative Indole-3-acetic acid-induced protein ARG2 [Tripterygium wilfordii]